MLYLHKTLMRLALKLFRGEPAISGFDWNFSAIHSSSPPFSTDVWFGPPWDCTPTSTWPWIGHPDSGLRHATSRPIKTRFPFGSTTELLNLASDYNSPDHSTKGTTSHVDVLCVLVSTRFQVLFTPLPGFFSPFLHSTIRYRSLGSI